MGVARRAIRPISEPSQPGGAFAASIVALLFTVLISSIVLVATGHDPIVAWQELVQRSVLRASGRQEILVRAAPLLLTGIGVLVAVRAGVWNIGIDGQVLVGALTAGVVGANLDGLPRTLLWLIAAVGGGSAGALWAAIPAILRARWGINDVVTSIMFTYVATSLTSWLVKAPFRDQSVVTPQTALIPVASRLSTLGDTRVHLGVLAALILALILWGVLRRSVIGYKLRVVGDGPDAARYAHIPVKTYLFGAFVVSGSIAGLAGVNDVLATKGTFQAEWNPQYGLSAFALVYLARRDPRGLFPAALLLGLLSYGADVMPRAADIPPQFFSLFEGVLLVTLVCIHQVPGLADLRGWWSRE